MKKQGFVLALLALALTGCQTCERHPIACTVIAGSIALSSPALIRGHSGSTGTTGPIPDIRIQPVSCVNGSCK